MIETKQMKTQDEIAEYFRNNHKDHEFMGGFSGELVGRLKFPHAKEFLKDDAKEHEWNKKVDSAEPDKVLADMKSYMEFAIDKALDHRGLSASRSLEHMHGFLFLLDDMEMVEKILNGPYKNYGCPALKAICDNYNAWPKDLDPSGKEMVERMAQGLACYGGCESGCGK